MNAARGLISIAAAQRMRVVGRIPSQSKMALPLHPNLQPVCPQPSCLVRHFADRNQKYDRVNVKMAKGRLPRDEEIAYPFIHLRDDETGKLSDPVPPQTILERLNRKEESLVVIVLPGQATSKKKVAKQQAQDDGDTVEWWSEDQAIEEEQPEEEDVEGSAANEEDAVGTEKSAPVFPICRIINRRAEHKALLEKHRQQRLVKVNGKTMEINWGIMENDLNVRLRQMARFMSKGNRVDVVLKNKRRGGVRRATPEEAKHVYDQILHTALKEQGCRQYKAQEGELCGILRLFFVKDLKK